MPSSSNRDSRHHDLMEGAVTTELSKQPLWSESNTSYKVNIRFKGFAPRPLRLGITHSTVVASFAQWLEKKKSGFREFEFRFGIFSRHFFCLIFKK